MVLERMITGVLGHFDIIESHALMVTKAIIVNRGWRERLFTRPWRPWVKTKMEITQEPSEEIYRIGARTFVCHPTTANKLRLKLEKAEKDLSFDFSVFS